MAETQSHRPNPHRMNSLPAPTPMDRAAKSEDDIQFLRALCDEAASPARRLELLQSLRGRVFRDPEHQVVFESISFLFPRGGVSAGRLAVHMNNRGFPDVDLDKYFPGSQVKGAGKEIREKKNLTEGKRSEDGFGTRAATIVLTVASLAALSVFFARPLLRFIRESLMQRATSAHYEVLSPPGAMTPETLRQFAFDREALFTTLDRKLDDAGSNAEIQIIFYPDSSAPFSTAGTPQRYAVTGTTIRTVNHGRTPQLDPAADAEALLHAAWGDPGNSRLGQWAAAWLLGEWHGAELGMAAGGVEQRIGHKKVSSLLDPSTREISSPEDQTLLGAAWLSEIAELDGPAEVRKLYLAKMPELDLADVTRTVGTTPLELERQWQMWMYAYLAGMPSPTQSAPMNMPMQGR
jgi:hypothetical protein